MELGASEVSGTSLRHRHKEATRRELRAVALELFERNGFSRTSVDDIARAAAVSRSTFFRYFPSKETLLIGEADGNADLFLRLLAERPPHEGRMKALEATLVSFAQKLRSDERRDEVLLLERIIAEEPSLNARRAAVVARWRLEVSRVLAARRGQEEPDLEDALAAAVLTQITEQLANEWRTGDGLPPVRDLIHNYFAALRRLIADP
jgi:AcrR family transcriptional regulator